MVQELERHAVREAPTSHASLLDEVIDHCKHTWADVVQGKGNSAEDLEVGAEVVVGAAVVGFGAKLGLSKLLPTAEKILPKEVSLSERTLPDVSLGDFGRSTSFPGIEAARAERAEQLAKEFPLKQRIEMARMPDMDADRLAIMAHDPHPNVRLAVIKHPNTSFRTLAHMSKNDPLDAVANEAYFVARDR